MAERSADALADGFHNVRQVYRNLPSPALYEHSIRRNEATLAHRGPPVVQAGRHRGPLPRDKFIVGDAGGRDHIWWGYVNRPFEPEAFDRLHHREVAYLQGKEVFVQDRHAGADPEYRVALRVITETAWHSLFARHVHS